MTNKRAVQAFLATSALFLAMSGMNARAQDASAPAASAQAPAAAPAAPQTDARAGKPGHHHGGQGGFKAIDTNGDGQISRDEAKGHAWLEKNFDQIDANHDGKITEDEIRAYMKARHDARKAQKNTPAAAAMPGGPSATKGE